MIRPVAGHSPGPLARALAEALARVPFLEVVPGSAQDDWLGNGSRFGLLLGLGGDDILEGGGSPDLAIGGAGDDTFVFRPGDLDQPNVAPRGRPVDTVLDFHGAGGAGPGEQDVIRLEGFGAGTTLAFRGQGPQGPQGASLQLYEVVDPTTRRADGFILVGMADGTGRLGADDVEVVAPNLAPTFEASGFAFEVAEGDAPGTVAGVAPASDPEGGPLSYAILESADGDPANDVPFWVDESGAVITTEPLAPGATYRFTLLVSDEAGLTDMAPVAVEVGEAAPQVPDALDLVTANVGDNTVSVRLGDRAGGFTPALDVPVGDNALDAPAAVALGDLDGDGLLDLLATDYGGTVTVRLGDGQGGFAAAPDVEVGASPGSIAVGDLNGDGALDFATANTGDGTISVRLGDGRGGFSAAAAVRGGDQPDQVTTGDLDGDGDLDLLASNVLRDRVSVRLNDGTGGFAEAENVAVGDDPRAVALGDLDGDGALDILAGNVGDDDVSVRLGDGQGGFSAAPDVAVGDDPYSIAPGDFNGDGLLDFATANRGNSVSVRLGDGAGGFSAAPDLDTAGDFPIALAAGDLDADGDLDLAVASYLGGLVDVWLGDGRGEFEAAAPVLVGASPGSLALGDLGLGARLTPSGLPDLGGPVPADAWM